MRCAGALVARGRRLIIRKEHLSLVAWGPQAQLRQVSLSLMGRWPSFSDQEFRELSVGPPMPVRGRIPWLSRPSMETSSRWGRSSPESRAGTHAPPLGIHTATFMTGRHDLSIGETTYFSDLATEARFRYGIAGENAKHRLMCLQDRSPSGKLTDSNGLERWPSGLRQRFAKPSWGYTPPPRVRIPPSPFQAHKRGF